ncbi:MAG: hypothetical protein ACJAVV_002703 [Alphaproteobacteria bacterium]|jgi:hypothetical protein
MNNIKQVAILCMVALTQFLIIPCVNASDEDYSNINEVPYSEAELAQILAPIALYPDSLLTHIVIASTYPLEVVEAYRWRERNSDLDASEAAERAQNKGWDPSIAALVAFPSVLERLNDDLQWTQNLGDAFLEDEGRVLDTIQALRQQAEQANSFDNMQNMRVTRVNRQIVIEPVQKEIVYVPYYDTRVVYGNWHWNRYPPVHWNFRPHLSVYFPSGISSRFHWGSGINIGFNYHFSAFKWRSRHLVVTHHHKTRKYRSYSRIVSSQGAKRWEHKPTHRRGVAYRSNKLKSHYSSRKHSKLYAKHLRTSKLYNSASRTRLDSKKHHKNFGKTNKADRNERRSFDKYNKESRFSRKLKNNTQRSSWKGQNSKFTNNVYQNRGETRARESIKVHEYGKRSNQRNDSDKLARNSKFAPPKYNASKPTKRVKKVKRSKQARR